MSIVAALIINVVLVLLIAGGLGAVAGKSEGDGFFGGGVGLVTGYILFWLSVFGWVVFIALHFLAKVW
jgi:hypothetical protein